MNRVFSFILLLSAGSAVEVSMTGVFDIAGQINTTKSIIDLIYDLNPHKNRQGAGNELFEQDGMEEKLNQITGKIDQLSQKIDNLGSELSIKIDDVAINIINELINDNRLTMPEKNVVERMLDIKNWFNQYREYRNLNVGYPSIFIQQFVTYVTNDDVKSSIDKLYEYTIPGGTGINNLKGIIDLILTIAQEKARKTCGHGLSEHQKLYILYISIMMTEFKYFTISSYAYKQLAKFDPNENYFSKFILLWDDFDRRARGYLAAFRGGMKASLKSIRTCDPAVQVKGETYLELERLFGPYVINEYDMDFKWKIPKNDPIEKCKSTCNDPEMTPYVGECTRGFCHDDQYLCRGKLQNCRTAMDLEFCMREDFKRYIALKFNGVSYGGEITCPESRKKTARSFIRPGGEYPTRWTCDTCVCTCAYDKKKTDSPNTYKGFIEIHNTLINADINKNNVITGVKFEVIECASIEYSYTLLHLKIRQGKLSNRGKVVGESWKSPSTTMSGSRFEINEGEIQNNVHAALLHNVNAPDGYVIIGVGLEKSPNSRMFGIRIKAAKVNFDTGELDTSEIYDSGYPSIPHLTELTLKNPDSPLKNTRNLLNSSGKETVKFQMSDLEKDAGASTVPFFDFQPVLTTPAFPLSAIGLIHRGKEGFGGFIAPTIDTYEFSDDIKLPGPPETVVN